MVLILKRGAVRAVADKASAAGPVVCGARVNSRAWPDPRDPSSSDRATGFAATLSASVRSS